MTGPFYRPLVLMARRAAYYLLASMAWLRGLRSEAILSPPGFSGVHTGLRSAESCEMYTLHGWRPYVFQRGPSRYFLIAKTEEERAFDEVMEQVWADAGEAQRDRYEEEARCWDRWSYRHWHSAWLRAPWASCGLALLAGGLL